MAGKKTGKRLLTWVLVLVMALSLLPLNALASGEGGSSHEDVVNGYYDDSGVWKQGVSSAQPDVPGIVSISKTAARAANTNPEDNTYEVTLRVKTEGIKDTNKAATVLVIDTSASMDQCMKKEHTHNEDCYTFTGPECNSESYPDHWWIGISGKPHHKEFVKCNYDRKTGNYYITDEKVRICDKEEHSHRDGNCYTRLDAAKKAAIDFLDSYRKGAQSGSGRYVALVAFNKTASNSTAWKDVSSSADYTAAKQWINGLSADGGTNLDAGLSAAGTKFNESPVSSIAAENRNIIVLTDGEPTYCLDSDGDVSGSGGYSTSEILKATNATATKIRDDVCPIHTICFAAGNEKIYTIAFGSITLSEYLETYIASDGKAYNASSYKELTDAFSAISDIITSQLTEAVVHDSLPKGVTAADSTLFNSNGKVAWNLFEDFEKEETAGGTTVYTKTYTVTIDPKTAGKANGEYCPLNGPTTLTVKSQSTPNGATLPFPIPAGLVTVQNTPEPEPDPTPATVTLSDDEGKSLIKKHLTVNGDGLAEDTYFVVAITPKTEKEKGIIPSNLLYGATSTVGTVTNNTFTSNFFFTDQNSNPISLTFSAPGEYSFTVEEVTNDYNRVEHMQYDDTVYTMTVNVTPNDGNTALVAAVSFTTDGQTEPTNSITFNNTYTAPAYPVYVYAFFAHDDDPPLKGEVTVNGKKIEWNENSANGQYFVTLGVYQNGTTQEPTNGATGLVLKDLNVTEYEAATSQGNGTKNGVTLTDITGFPYPYGKVCSGAAGYPESEGKLSWHLDGQVDVYTVTYDDGMTEGEPTSNVYYFGSYIIAAAPERDGYTFTGWKDDNGDVYQAGDEITLKKDLKLVAQWTARTDLSYTVNYLEKDTNEVLHEEKIQTGVTFGAEIDSADEIITINGYNYDSADKETLTIGTGENVINLYYTKRTDLSYTVHYYLKNTTKPVANDKRVNGQTFNAVVKEEAIRIRGYRVYGDSVKSITIGTGTNEIIFYYTRAYHPSTPSKPTLNTGDHYAYVMGYPDGTVRPNGSITRAEVSAILFRLLSDETRDEYFTTESSFTDVKAGAWYNNSIATLEKAGVIVDTAKGGAFRPNEAITRAELAAMLAQFSDAKPVKGVKFSDVSAEHWAYEAIAIAAKMGWIEGYPDGTFRPDATITRAEMMTLVNRALERVPSDEDHLLSKRVMLTFPDCKSGDWFYIAVQEATNSHTYERAATEKNGDEQWTALRANRDWTLLEK